MIGTVPEPGHGGEYQVQTGFGWSNGVVLDLLSMYYDRIEMKEPEQEKEKKREREPGKEPKDAPTAKMEIILPILTMVNVFYQNL